MNDAGAPTSFNPAILLIASLAGYIGYPHSTTHSMSRFGVRGLFYGLRERALHSSIRVSLVAPRFVDTAITRQPDFLKQNGPVLDLVAFASMYRAGDAITRFALAQDLCKRSVGVFPRGNEDIGDNLEDGYNGAVVSKHMREVKSVLA